MTMTVLPITSRPRWLSLIFVLFACPLALSACSTKQPAYVRDLPPIPANLAGPAEPLKAIPRLKP